MTDVAQTWTTVSVTRQGPVAVVRLENPPVNAIGGLMDIELGQALRHTAGEPDVGAIVLVGDGRGFSAGGDTKKMGVTEPVAKHRRLQELGSVAKLVVELPVPIVAAVHGFAVGAGLSLALASDVTIVEESTTLRLGFLDMAITPDMGGHHFLVEALGVRRAKELIWSGASFTAEQAVEWGLVNRCVSDGTALEAALEAATRIASGPRHAIAYTKAILAGVQADQLRRILDDEAWASAMLRNTADHVEAAAARREKRPPVFGKG